MNKIKFLKQHNNVGYDTLVKCSVIISLILLSSLLSFNIYIFSVVFIISVITEYMCYDHQYVNAINYKRLEDRHNAELRLFNFCRDNFNMLNNKCIYVGEYLFDNLTFTLHMTSFIRDDTKQEFEFSLEPGPFINTINDLYE